MNLIISNLRERYLEGSLTPEELCTEILTECEKHDHHNIWIKRFSLEELQHYFDQLKNRDPADYPLYGIPFAVKDNIDIAGIETTAACPGYAYTADQTAFTVQQLINAGAIPIGKTNMDQFATGLVGVRSPEPWGPCKNAFNEEYISGGSSSGSAVSVALGLVSFSLGTDTAGSGRVPAAFNNLVGLKPSRGLLSAAGVVPACRSLDCVSIFALTVDDANAVFSQMAEYDKGDAYARRNPFDNSSRFYGLPQGEFHFAVPQDNQLEFFGNEDAKTIFESSVKQLESLGGKKSIIDFTPFLEAARLLYEGPWVTERYVAIEEMITQKPKELLPVIETIIGGGAEKKASDAFKAEYEMQGYRQLARELLNKVDFMVTPTTGTIYTIEEVLADPIKLNSNLGYYTNFMNLLDCASVAVPAGFQSNGLPFGITLVSNAMSDTKLLSFANRWQQALNISTGKTGVELPKTQAEMVEVPGNIPVVVCGAHLEGLPLNWQLTERGAKLIERTKTANQYRMYALSGGPPHRPGLIRDDKEGEAIDVEIWSVPSENFGSFVATIPSPLGIGKVAMIDGRLLPGFICEAYAINDAQDISSYKNWRNYIGR